MSRKKNNPPRWFSSFFSGYLREVESGKGKGVDSIHKRERDEDYTRPS